LLRAYRTVRNMWGGVDVDIPQRKENRGHLKDDQSPFLE
jgi:hypothetical protein